MRSAVRLIALGLVVLLAAPLGAQADWKPEKTIKVYVGFGAGGGVDTLARIITSKISKNTGWNFTVLNKPGGGGSVAAKFVKSEDKDGHVISMTTSQTFTFTPLFNPKVGFVLGDFEHIAAITKTQGALVCLSDKPWKTLEDAVAAAKSGKKVKLAYLSPKLGMNTKAIEKAKGVKFVTIPTKGGAAAMKNLLGKHVDIAWGAGVQGKYVKSGKMRVLASCEKKRLAMAPDAPTLQEMGIKNAMMNAMFEFFGPKGMNKDAVAALSRELKKAVADPKIKELITGKMMMEAIFVDGASLREEMDQSLANSKALIEYVKK